jgi:hypothetical protein
MKGQDPLIDIWTKRDPFRFIQPTFCRWIQVWPESPVAARRIINQSPSAAFLGRIDPHLDVPPGVFASRLEP